MTLREEIADFLGRKRIAVVGVSTDQPSFSRGLFREFVKRGYDAIPVNPRAKQIEGRRCYASVCDIDPKPDAVLIMTPPRRTDEIVCDCAESGVDSVWMYGVGGRGAVSEPAIEFCRERGIHVIPGECPYMFFPKAGFHAIHGFFHKIISPALRQ
ncbi:MAG TPA: CoA-binding protein [Bryobacteraceae bacterium]|nr:CoA-binding protein [Bryobacteraceae bacterium]